MADPRDSGTWPAGSQGIGPCESVWEAEQLTVRLGEGNAEALGANDPEPSFSPAEGCQSPPVKVVVEGSADGQLPAGADIAAGESPPPEATGSPSPQTVVAPSPPQSPTPSDLAEALPGPPRVVTPTPSLSTIQAIYRRLGWVVALIVLGGTLGILGIMGFWTFLWFGSDSNPTWHWIMAHDHIKVLVSSTAEAVNRLTGFMIGAECSMILALALERSQVLFPSLASASAGRTGTGAGKTIGLSKKVVTSKWPTKRWDKRLPYLALFITLIETLSIGTHTVLFTDVNLGQIATRQNSSDVAFGLAYQPETISYAGGEPDLLYRYTAWQRKAPFYPAFAEYSEPPAAQEGTSDTGLTLRAILPYADPLVRQSVHSYTGRTTVLDARVTCQIPQFEQLAIEGQQNALLLSGFVRASRLTPRLGNESWVYTPKSDTAEWSRNVSAPFLCIAPLANTSTWGVPDQWRSALCQLAGDGTNDVDGGIAGGLVSEFKNYSSWLSAASGYTDGAHFGTAYLVFNVSAGGWELWQEAFMQQAVLPMPVPDGRPVDEWQHFLLPWGLSFSATLCYSAFDTADIPVSITTTTRRNRTEPEPAFNFATRRYTFTDIRRQYGQGADATDDPQQELERRGVLQLERQSWIAAPGIQPPAEPYIRQYANLAGPDPLGNGPNWSGFLWDAFAPQDNFNLTGYTDINQNPSVNWRSPDPMHGWLFQDIIAHGGSVAFALQSIITLLASMAYYDQLAQFDNRGTVAQSFFIETNLPTRYWGWLAVVIVLVIHLGVSWTVLLWFVHGTEHTLLGQTWQALAQASTLETREFIDMASEMKDDEVKQMMTDKLRKSSVRLGPFGENGKVGIYLDDEGQLN
jgi:hypothetical protein